jgi:hypothetical protein
LGGDGVDLAAMEINSNTIPTPALPLKGREKNTPHAPANNSAG